MSEQFRTAGTDTAEDATGSTDTAGTTYPAPLLRFMPAITFGVRAAALAGMAVSAGALAFGLAGAFDDVTAGAYTTCCGEPLNPS
jgi:hypothetical protein